VNIERIELGEICEFLDSKRVPVTESDRKPGPYPYYGANGQQGWIDGFIFDEPLILLAEDGGAFGSKTRPIAYKVTGKYWVNNHAHVLRPYSNCDLNYLCHILSFYDVTKYVNGTTRQKLTKSEAEQIPIPFPPLPEQRRIAALLDKADHLRRTRRYAAQLSDTFLQAVFVRMFGDPVRNPMGWDVEILEPLTDRIDYGVTASSNPMPIGPKFLRITDIQNGMVNWAEVPYCQTSEEERRNSLLQDGDIVFARTGATTGKSFLIRNCPPNAVFASYLIRVRPNEKIDPIYLSGYFQSKAYWLQISENVVGSTQPGVNATKLGELRIIIPPLALQKKFARVVQQFEHLRAQQREAERQAEHLFQTLLHRAFSGEV